MSDFPFLITPESLQAFVYIVAILVVFYVIMWVILKIVAHFKKKPEDVKKAQGLNLTLSSGADLATTSGLLSIDDNGNIFSMGFPKGMIIMWKPQSANLTPPVGWAVCDGNTPGVPNLTNKFIRAGTATDAANGVSAGADTVKLVKDNLPDHTHTLPYGIHSDRDELKDFRSGGGDGEDYKYGYFGNQGVKGSVWTAKVGANWSLETNTKNMDNVVNTSFSILPSYYTLVYLMKL